MARLWRIPAVWLTLAAAAQQPGASLPALLQRFQVQPDDYRLCQEIGVAYTRSEQLDKAAEFFRKAVRLKPAFLPARKNLATVLWFLNHKQESEREFQALVKLLPNDPAPRLYLGLAAYDRKQYADAVAHLEKAGALALENPEVLPVLAEAYDRQGAPEKAHQMYIRVIALAPDSADAYASFAAFACAHRNNAFALRVLDQGLGRVPDSAKLWLERGIILALDGGQEQAEISFRKAGERHPQWSLPWLSLGIGQLERGQFVDAAASFRQAIAREPTDDRARYLLAAALKRDPKSQDEMVAALRKALDLNGSNTRARVALAEFYSASDRLAAAIAELETAVARDPGNAAALYQLGLAYQRQGKVEKSRQTLREFQKAKARMREDETELVQILKTLPAAR
jgi:tetratricopeptide (TPR) repeat protein